MHVHRAYEHNPKTFVKVYLNSTLKRHPEDLETLLMLSIMDNRGRIPSAPNNGSVVFGQQMRKLMANDKLSNAYTPEEIASMSVEKSKEQIQTNAHKCSKRLVLKQNRIE